MKNFKIYAFLTFLLLGSISVSAQSFLNLYFGGNKDSLINEATKLIHVPEPVFKPKGQQIEPDAYMYNKTGGLLQEATPTEVYAIDLRRTIWLV